MNDQSNNSIHVNKLVSLLNNHQDLRDSYLNLVAAENVLSPLVRKTLSSDLAGRYSSEFYGGSNFTRKIIEIIEELAKDLFNSDFACITPISGNICDLAVLNSLTTVGDTISLISMQNGGYPFQIEQFDRKVAYLPFDNSKWNIDYQQLGSFFERNFPRLIILGASVIIYPYQIANILKHIDLMNQYVVYDGSHVLGLIAGNKFQNPLKDGVPLLFGSTHKSFPGPQGGIIISNDREIFSKVSSQFSIQTSDHPFGKSHGTILVDNVHANRIAALGFAILEMLEFGKEYAARIVKNSNALGRALETYGFQVKYNPEVGISETHQILLPMSTTDGTSFKSKLENVGIFVDAFVRIGTAEVTRRGLREADMKTVAEFIFRAANEEESQKIVKNEVREFCANFQGLDFCFKEIKDFS